MKLEEERKITEQKRQLEEQKRQELLAKQRYEKALSDREPTESQMNAAVRRTFAGALFGANIRKVGKCRKVAEHDYYCRYNYLGPNWGNFWKDNGTWYFEIAN
jgi:hypothetical protein